MAKLFRNSEDYAQTYHSASGLGLHCLPITILGVSKTKMEGPTNASASLSGLHPLLYKQITIPLGRLPL